MAISSFVMISWCVLDYSIDYWRVFRTGYLVHFGGCDRDLFPEGVQLGYRWRATTHVGTVLPSEHLTKYSLDAYFTVHNDQNFSTFHVRIKNKQKFVQIQNTKLENIAVWFFFFSVLNSERSFSNTKIVCTANAKSASGFTRLSRIRFPVNQ